MPRSAAKARSTSGVASREESSTTTTWIRSRCGDSRSASRRAERGGDEVLLVEDGDEDGERSSARRQLTRGPRPGQRAGAVGGARPSVRSPAQPSRPAAGPGPTRYRSTSRAKARKSSSRSARTRSTRARLTSRYPWTSTFRKPAMPRNRAANSGGTPRARRAGRRPWRSRGRPVPRRRRGASPRRGSSGRRPAARARRPRPRRAPAARRRAAGVAPQLLEGAVERGEVAPDQRRVERARAHRPNSARSIRPASFRRTSRAAAPSRSSERARRPRARSWRADRARGAARRREGRGGRGAAERGSGARHRPGSRRAPTSGRPQLRRVAEGRAGTSATYTATSTSLWALRSPARGAEEIGLEHGSAESSSTSRARRLGAASRRRVMCPGCPAQARRLTPRAWRWDLRSRGGSPPARPRPRSASSRSDSIIRRTSSSKVVRGFQPSFSRPWTGRRAGGRPRWAGSSAGRSRRTRW